VDDKNTPLFEGLPGEPLLLQCNLSEHYSNVLITADDGFGAVDYRPGISMKDGRLAKEAGVYDFSIYEAALEEDTVQSAMDLLMQTEEIQMAMQQGMSLMYTGDTELIGGRPCLLFTIGTGPENHFVREGYYAVDGNMLYAFDNIYGVWTALGVG